MKFRQLRKGGRSKALPPVAAACAVVFVPWALCAVSNSLAGADSTGALQARLDAAPPGGYVKLDPQVYQHHGVLKLRVPGVRIDGGGATFESTNDATSAVQITADRVQLTNVTLTAPTQGKRYEDLDQHKLVLSGAGDVVEKVTIAGSAAAGIFVNGAQGFTIRDVRITGTRADGIHMTKGSENGVVEGVDTDATGDDGVAVVSYESDRQRCSDIRISGVHVASTRFGRGIAIVGARNVNVDNFSVANTSAAGVYVATEAGDFHTASVDDVTIAGGSVDRVNYDPHIVQGAVLVYAGNAGTGARNIQISGLTVTATDPSAQRNVAVLVGKGSIGAVSLRDINIRESSLPPFFTNAPAGSYATSGWTLDSNPITVG
ncbi:MAG: hypothetical protein QOH60_4770 [Mycobacterium sp.]|jgi:hypothetical protein|nr:hypothetical protein [Mycobacterium sp.]